MEAVPFYRNIYDVIAYFFCFYNSDDSLDIVMKFQNLNKNRKLNIRGYISYKILSNYTG